MLKSKEILRLIAIILVELMLEILSFVVVPVALLFCKKEDEHLPKIFRWFEDANDYYVIKNYSKKIEDKWGMEWEVVLNAALV